MKRWRVCREDDPRHGAEGTFPLETPRAHIRRHLTAAFRSLHPGMEELTLQEIAKNDEK